MWQTLSARLRNGSSPNVNLRAMYFARRHWRRFPGFFPSSARQLDLPLRYSHTMILLVVCVSVKSPTIFSQSQWHCVRLDAKRSTGRLGVSFPESENSIVHVLMSVRCECLCIHGTKDTWVRWFPKRAHRRVRNNLCHFLKNHLTHMLRLCITFVPCTSHRYICAVRTFWNCVLRLHSLQYTSEMHAYRIEWGDDF